ncbi:Enoyl-CoA hydratase [Minicystis rosea]|nr:Enoyl-CoA hydratase [Minicystis rosea]
MISVAIDRHVATVSILKTTMPPAFFYELEAAFRALAKDAEVRAVVIRSAVKAFSYGLDLPAAFQEHGQLFAGGGAANRAALLATIRSLQGTITAVADSPVPVIAAIHGACIGGGLDLAAACDVRLASADAKISLREVKVAIVADLGSLQRLPPIIGAGQTRELAFTGKTIDAARALRIGLVNEVYATQEELFAAAEAMAREIAQNPPLTVRGIKDVLRAGEGKSVAEGLEYVATYNAAFLASEDLGEAMAAFIEKREPRYKGR